MLARNLSRTEKVQYSRVGPSNNLLMENLIYFGKRNLIEEVETIENKKVKRGVSIDSTSVGPSGKAKAEDLPRLSP